jgi:Fe-S-cluster-containing hydrogenase component 2
MEVKTEQKILFDMIRLRAALAKDPEMALPELLYYPDPNINGLKPVSELAAFMFSCRKCKDAPCIAACPENALEKDGNGLVNRYTNLCISCKSCVAMCPFGTIMSDFFRHHRNRDLFRHLNDDEDIGRLIKEYPEGVVSLTVEDESPERNIYRLNERVLVREIIYSDNR